MILTPLPPGVTYYGLPDFESSVQLGRMFVKFRDYHALYEGNFSQLGWLDGDPFGNKPFSLANAQARFDSAVTADEIDEAPTIATPYPQAFDNNEAYGYTTTGVETDVGSLPYVLQAQIFLGTWIVNLFALYRYRLMALNLIQFHRSGRPENT
jgi:hypothetical protein